jgi:tartrate dehydratase alpha subunit/fumarate hydratase class I-like protein
MLKKEIIMSSYSLTKGGGSANKTFLYQKTKSLLNEKSLEEFIKERFQILEQQLARHIT